MAQLKAKAKVDQEEALEDETSCQEALAVEAPTTKASDS